MEIKRPDFVNFILKDTHSKVLENYIKDLENRINEARKYINRELLIKYKQDFELIEISHIKKILEILDKVGDKE